MIIKKDEPVSGTCYPTGTPDPETMIERTITDTHLQES
jgi:hypothetical protein